MFCAQLLIYEVGFLVCIAIGVLYIVLMPIIGFCLACCRCCGNCGGEMYQKQTSSIHCRRRTLYWSALITTAIILWVSSLVCLWAQNEMLLEISTDGLNKYTLMPVCVCLSLIETNCGFTYVCVCVCRAGNICMFKSNEDLKVGVDQSIEELNKAIDNIQTFLTVVPQVRGALWLIGVM